MTLRTGLVMALAVLVVDQALKLFALHAGHGAPVAPVPPGTMRVAFGLVLNPGVFFGMVLPEGANGQEVLVMVAVALAAVILVRMMNSRHLLLNLGRGAVIGGAASNALDRIRLGAVVDYVVLQRDDFVIVFNLADVAVVFGAALLLGGAAFYTLTGRWSR